MVGLKCSAVLLCHPAWAWSGVNCSEVLLSPCYPVWSQHHMHVSMSLRRQMPLLNRTCQTTPSASL